MKAAKVLGLALIAAIFMTLAIVPATAVVQDQTEKQKAEVKKMVDKVTKALDASTVVNDNVKTYIKAKLVPYCTNPVYVKEVKAQNAKKTSLTEIKKIDQEWKDAEDELPIHVEKTGNACAKEIKKAILANPAIVEAFAMCNQGANVGQNTLTSDYWQGDEAKWQKSFNKGLGGIDAGKVEFDKSANLQLQQISLPIINIDGKVIGAITYGLAIDRIGG